MSFEIGARVCCPGGDVGHVEEADGEWTLVRVLTPRNEPSCCLTDYRTSSLTDGTNVLPMPRSEVWWREARAFHAKMKATLDDFLA